MPVRWAGEQVVETVPVQITKELEVKEVLLVDDNLRSPGGSKPMQRKYKYQSTPEAAEFDSEYAEKVHEKNLVERSRAVQDLMQAEQDQSRIENKHRKRKQYERNKAEYGTARKPAGAGAKRKATSTPATAAGLAKQGRAEALSSGSDAGAAGAPVATELSWEGM
jgi:hypothetical protein